MTKYEHSHPDDLYCPKCVAFGARGGAELMLADIGSFLNLTGEHMAQIAAAAAGDSERMAGTLGAMLRRAEREQAES